MVYSVESMGKTKSIGAGKKNLTVTVTGEEEEALRAMAKQSGMSRNQYCLHILQLAIASPPRFKRTTEVSSSSASVFPEEVQKVLNIALKKSKIQPR